MMCAVMVHPSQSTVIPLTVEPILKQDGATKNDCGTPRGVYKPEVKVLTGKRNPPHPESSFGPMEVTT